MELIRLKLYSSGPTDVIAVINVDSSVVISALSKAYADLPGLSEICKYAMQDPMDDRTYAALEAKGLDPEVGFCPIKNAHLMMKLANLYSDTKFEYSILSNIKCLDLRSHNEDY